MDVSLLFQIVILIFSVIIHEISHGFMALFFGDKTAEYEGRLTLNPIKHIDLFGSIILPLLLIITKAGFVIGWAKPVPYNPYNLQNKKVAEPLVALAGPLSNLVIALFFGIIIRFLNLSGVANYSLLSILSFVVFINIALSIFNLIPIPPLDGSKVFFSLFPSGEKIINSRFAKKYGLIILIAVIILVPKIIFPISYKLFTLFTGLK